MSKKIDEFWERHNMYKGEPLSPNPFKGAHIFFGMVGLVWALLWLPQLLGG